MARNDKGEIIGFAMKRLVDGTNNVAKVEAAILAVSLGKKLDVMHLHLEGDSKLVVEAISKGSIQAWFYQNMIQNIRETSGTFADFKVSHVYREGNDEADKLENWATTFCCINEVEVDDL